MQILLQLRSKTPIYEQIVMQVKQQILSGALADGDAIPSMRTLAKTLQVSVITVQKAYEELARRGLIESLAGRGTFIRAQNTEDIRQEYLASIRSHMQEIIKLAKGSSVGIAEIINIMEAEFAGGTT